MELPDGRDLRFQYDAFSRRLGKTVVQRASSEDDIPERILKETHWRWDGHNALTELDSEEGKTDWLYDPETFNPLAKLKNGAVWGVITDQVGTPTELFSQDGQLVYSTIVDLTGDSRQVVGDVDCPFRWPGQYEDKESGLYYNKNRYYDPAVESYLSADPIGLAGGLRAYGYVEDPLSWIDPLGLSKCAGTGGDAGRAAPRPLSPNQMNRAIETRAAPRGIQRVDVGRIPGEQTHVHLRCGAALNIDGTWKHGSATLTSKQRTWLSANGWTIP